MIFSELYSAYYNTVAKIISHIISGKATESELADIVKKYAFGESALSILPSLKSEKWQLITKKLSTPIEHIPSMPLTNLEKSWLKAISLDKRIMLFGLNFEGLEEVEPLFTEEDYYIYDKYGDGDPYCDEGYIKRFRVILSAIRDKAPIQATMINRFGKAITLKCVPIRLEYSEKDDKFRVVTSGNRNISTMNLARIVSCTRYEGNNVIKADTAPRAIRSLTLELTDERNTLERCMLHFAHFEKTAEIIGNNKYLLRLKYDKNDETEMVIRILSFGPTVKVTEPQEFTELIREKLKNQKNCGLK